MSTDKNSTADVHDGTPTTWAEVVKRTNAHPAGGAWAIKCPCHDDKKESGRLSQKEDEGGLLFYCNVGCTYAEFVDHQGWDREDLDALPYDESSTHPVGGDGQHYERTEYKSAEDCIAEMTASVGRPAGVYRYYTREPWALVKVIVRWELPNGKKDPAHPFKVITRVKDGVYIVGGQIDPNPLYRLLDLTEDTTTVCIFEGEKKADFASELGLCAVASAHGADGVDHTDWTPLAGHDLVIFPDHDAKGKEYALKVAAKCLALSPPATVCLVDLPGLEEKEDIVDWVTRRWPLEDDELDVIRAIIHDLVAYAPELTAEQVRKMLVELDAKKLPDGFAIEVEEEGANGRDTVTFRMGDDEFTHVFYLADAEKRDRAAKIAAGRLGLKGLEKAISYALDKLALERRNAEKAMKAKRRILSYDDIMALTDPTWMVKSILPDTAVAMIFGAYGDGKSFIALDWCLNIVCGFPWLGEYDTIQGHVAYLQTESPNGFKKRIRAWEQFHSNVGGVQDQIRQRFHLIPHPFKINQPSEVKKLAALIRGRTDHPKLIVIDTLSKNIAGHDCDMDAMAGFIDAAGQLKEMFNCTVLIVHHTGWANQDHSRGSSSLPGGIDTNIQVEKLGKKLTDGVTLRFDKQKESESGHEIGLNFTLIPYGDGEFDNSFVVSSKMAEGSAEDVGQIKPPKQSKRAKAKASELVADCAVILAKLVKDGPMIRNAVKSWFERTTNASGRRFDNAWYQLIDDRKIIQNGTIKGGSGKTFETWAVSDGQA
jgi:hypothetical protein